jgi:hypothetical protein
MIARLACTLTILLGLAGCFSVRATTTPAAVEARIPQLAQWIADNSDLAPMRKAPEIKIVTPEYINKLGGRVSRGAEVYGAYAFGVVYLRTDFVPGRSDSILLHELVHHLQSEQNIKYECRQQRERLAYQLQSKYDNMPMTVRALLLSSCDPRI